MLLIEQIYETNGLKSDYVKCPVCKQGRLCDKPMGDKVMVIAVSEGTGHQTGNRIILNVPNADSDLSLQYQKNNSKTMN